MFNQKGFVYGIAVSSESLMFAMMVLASFLLLAIFISLIRIYQKAGKPGISAIVPIWGQINFIKIINKSWLYIILLFIPICLIIGIIPIVNKSWFYIYLVAITVINIFSLMPLFILMSKKFGKGAGFGVAMAFLPMIFIPLLSFYDYVDNKEVKIEDPIYNPFDQSNVEPVMPSAPIQNLQEGTNLNVTPENVIGENEIINTVSETPLVNDNVSQQETTNFEPAAINIPIINDLQNDNSNNSVDDLDNVGPIVNNEDVLSNLSNPEVENVPVNFESVISDMPVQSQEIANVEENIDLSTNNIEDVISIAKKEQPVNIAFNSQPVEIMDNTIETLDKDENSSTTDLNNVETLEDNNDEIIEMPEIATKMCPACGTSLAEDIKFCTSCGTQL